MSFQSAQDHVLHQYFGNLKEELVNKFEAKKPFTSTSNVYEDTFDNVPSNAVLASIQEEDEPHLEQMKKLMTTNLSNLTVILKKYWESEHELDSDKEVEELSGKMAEIVRKALFTAGVETFVNIDSKHSPSWIVLHRYLRSFADGDPTRQQIWNFTRDNIQDITQSEALVWVRYASEALIEHQQVVHEFMSQVQVE